MNDDSIFLTIEQTCKQLHITRQTELVWRKNGTLPKPVRLSKRVLYRIKDIANLPTTK